MKSVELWQIVIAKNPSFIREENITLTARGLKKLFDLAYEKGHEHGFENGKAWSQMQCDTMPGRASDPVDIFKDVFKSK